jgi:RND superfamily putative drug exporter
MAASITTMIQVGFVIGTGILLDTFLVRTITVPAMAAIVGRANWWPHRWWPLRRSSKPAQRRHRRRTGEPSVRDVYADMPIADNGHHRHHRPDVVADSATAPT